MFLTAFWVVFASLCPAADPGEGPGGPGSGRPGGPGKFLLVSISRKMKGEKIAICWPKSWANRFRKFHFLELYKIDIFIVLERLFSI